VSLQEYTINDQDVDEWLPWGGLVRESVVKNKDDSFFGVIAYVPYPKKDDKKIKYREYRKGWVIWTEKQHREGEDRCYLIVCWNPFYRMTHIAENALGAASVSESEAALYFEKELSSIAKDLSKVTTCKVLAYQDVIDFLAFSLSLGDEKITMPEVPLYLDVLLSQDLQVEFLENGLAINHKQLLVFTPLSIPSMSIMNILYQAFEKVPYRYVQRLLLFDQKSAEADLNKYMDKWCSGRKYVKNALKADLLSNLNGYYSNNFFFLLDEENYQKVDHYCRNIMETLGLSYVVESYNLKDVWWGSLAGIFRANINPLVTGFDCLDDLLVHPTEENTTSIEIGGTEPNVQT